jgi:SAM-dependent methyltransferase
MVLDIEKIALPDNSVDVVIANHVLEHVDDKAALSEVHRILKPDGRLIVSVPIVDGWADTYEDPGITGALERRIHFGQDDHIRFYGRDFRERLKLAGFDSEAFVCGGADTVKFSLFRGEPIFICSRLPAASTSEGAAEVTPPTLIRAPNIQSNEEPAA